MTEILTGKQLRDRAEGCLDQRRPDKESLRNWIRRGADRIDKLTKEVQRMEDALESGGSEAALMMLEDARQAADNTLERVRQMEMEAEQALDRARENAEKESRTIIDTAHAEAADIIASGRDMARMQLAKAEAASQERLDQAVAHAEKVDRDCRHLVEQARALDRTYRQRIADIRVEARAMVALMDRLEALPIADPDDQLDSEQVIDDLLAEIVELNAPANDEAVSGDDIDADDSSDEVEEVG